MPHPKDVAAAASSSVPLQQGLYASPSSASLQGGTTAAAAPGPTDPAALLLPACYSSSSVGSSPSRRRQQQLAGTAAPKLTHRQQQQQQPPLLRPLDFGAGARSLPASPLGLVQGTPAPVKYGYGSGVYGWQQPPTGGVGADHAAGGHGIGPLFASQDVHLPSLEREGTIGELHLLPPSKPPPQQQQQKPVMPPPLDQEFSTLTVTASEGGFSGSKPGGSTTGTGTARGAQALGCEPSYASLGAVSSYSYLEQYASTSNLPLPHSPYMYGAGNTRYRRWSMQGIDPAHENPDYWQVGLPHTRYKDSRRRDMFCSWVAVITKLPTSRTYKFLVLHVRVAAVQRSSGVPAYITFSPCPMCIRVPCPSYHPMFTCSPGQGRRPPHAPHPAGHERSARRRRRRSAQRDGGGGGGGGGPQHGGAGGLRPPRRCRGGALRPGALADVRLSFDGMSCFQEQHAPGCMYVPDRFCPSYK